VTAPLTAQLRANPPGLHGEGDEYWGLAWPALDWLERNVEKGMATLETGAGSSTIVFAAAGADHEAITPAAEEAERIRRICAERGIDASHVTFRIGSSHEVLPAREPRPLDLVLIDGAHGFPYPILDWWYLAPHLKVGGLMLVDDAYMPPVAALIDGLRAQDGWEVGASVGYRTVVLRKIADVLPAFDWGGERIGGRMNFRYLPAAPRAVAAVRHRLFSTGLGLRLVGRARPTLRWQKRS
jgi:hypothetical protein